MVTAGARGRIAPSIRGAVYPILGFSEIFAEKCG